ncbi:MAG: chemotaxis protein CheB [Planctomycetota bacterium]
METTPIKALFAVPRIGMRLLFIREFQRNQEIKLASLAFSYEVALEQLREKHHYDIIVLDCVEGLGDPIALVRSIRSVRSGIPIILLCDHSVESKSRMLEAIRAGASDYIVAPTSSKPDGNKELLQGSLSRKIKTWANRSAHKLAAKAGSPVNSAAHQPVSGAKDKLESADKTTGTWNPTKPRNRSQSASALPNLSVAKPTRSNQQTGFGQFSKSTASLPGSPVGAMPEILAIASSTGGPAALKAVLGGLTADFPLPIVCVQHNLVGFDSLLVKQLNSQSKLTVQVAEDGQEIRPGQIYIAPADRHMTLKKKAVHHTIELQDGPLVCEVRPAADLLFQSVARHFTHRALGLVLTGMGVDGLEGSRAIRQAGGRVVAQSGPTCTVWGMPRAVEQAGLASSVLDLNIIAPTLLGLTNPNSIATSQSKTGAVRSEEDRPGGIERETVR